MDGVESALKDVFSYRLISAELTPLDRGSGFLVQFPQNPSGPEEIKALVDLHEQRGRLIELRLAYTEPRGAISSSAPSDRNQASQ